MKKTMKSVVALLVLSVLLVGCGTKDSSGSDVQFQEPKSGDTVAEIVVKDFGSIFVKFFPDAAPKAVENFVTHAKEGYYDGLTFHRIIKDFMIQGGDPTGTGAGGESIWGGSFEDEFSDDLLPYRGALCMANAGADTNGSQFFIVQAGALSQDELDYYVSSLGLELTEEQKENYMNVGGTPWLHKAHTVFGQMYDGFDVLDAIASVEADQSTGTPAENVIIEKIIITEYE